MLRRLCRNLGILVRLWLDAELNDLGLDSLRCFTSFPCSLTISVLCWCGHHTVMGVCRVAFEHHRGLLLDRALLFAFGDLVERACNDRLVLLISGTILVILLFKRLVDHVLLVIDEHRADIARPVDLVSAFCTRLSDVFFVFFELIQADNFLRVQAVQICLSDKRVLGYFIVAKSGQAQLDATLIADARSVCHSGAFTL